MLHLILTVSPRRKARQVLEEETTGEQKLAFHVLLNLLNQPGPPAKHGPPTVDWTLSRQSLMKKVTC